MREIKFRAWDSKENRWKYPVWDITNDLSKNNQNYLIFQFTGLQDKNGIDIYEGDIIKMDNGTLYTIVFRGMGFWFVDSDNEGYVFSPSAYQYEIIGNQFENPELL